MKNDPMKKLVLNIAGSIILISFLFGQSALFGQIVKEKRDLSGFTGVALSISGDVYITQGNQYKVEIEADRDMMNLIETDIDGNRLEIKKKHTVQRSFGPVRVYITMPKIEDLSVAGSGDIIAESVINTDEISLAVSGSGTLKLASLTANKIDANITGSGDIYVNGKSSNNSTLEATITGSGDLKAGELAVGEATVRITGSGSATVNVLNELKTNITGSGSVNYKGKPLVDANATGSGRTRSIN